MVHWLGEWGMAVSLCKQFDEKMSPCQMFVAIRVMAAIREEFKKLAHYLPIGMETKIFKSHLELFNFSARTGFSGSIVSSDSPARLS